MTHGKVKHCGGTLSKKEPFYNESQIIKSISQRSRAVLTARVQLNYTFTIYINRSRNRWRTIVYYVVNYINSRKHLYA